jgi:hypothetical protein
MPASPNRQKFEALFDDLSVVYVIETSVVLHAALFRGRQAAATFRAHHVPSDRRRLDGPDPFCHAPLVEPGARRGRRTASIETPLSHLPPDAAALRRELRKALTALRAECRGLADVRHPHIAHRDYSVVLEEEPRPDRVTGRSLLATIGGFA